MNQAVMPNINRDEAEALRGQEIVSSIAMTITLVSFGMLFATLMLTYCLYRFTTDVWPPMGITRPSLLLPSVSTAIILASSWTYKRFDSLKEKLFLGLTFLLGVGFLLTQLYFWNVLKEDGLYVNTGGVFSSIIYAFTWIHAFHIVGALFLLIWLLFNFDEKKIKNNFNIRVQNVGKFWHFLSIVWIFMFVSLFVL